MKKKKEFDQQEFEEFMNSIDTVIQNIEDYLAKYEDMDDEE